MFAARVKNYCAAGGGDNAGKRVTEGRQGQAGRASQPCHHLVHSHLLANLKKTQSCSTSLHLQFAPAIQKEALTKRNRKSRSVGDLSYYARNFTKCRRGVLPHAMERGGHGHGAQGMALEALDVRSCPGVLAARVCGAGGALSPSSSSSSPPSMSAALRVCQLLMLNAWRVRRAEARALRSRVDQMRLQVASLRALNNAETERAALAVQHANKERFLCDAAVDAVRQQLDALRGQHEALTKANADLEARLSEQQTATENLRNDLQASREEAAALDSQLAKERAKLASSREDRAKLKLEVEEKAIQLKEVEILLQEANSQYERVNRLTEVNGEELDRLSARVQSLEEALQSEQLATRQAQQTLVEQVQELERLRALLELERSPRRSALRILEVLRVPLGVLHAFYLAVCPFPSTRSL